VHRKKFCYQNINKKISKSRGAYAPLLPTPMLPPQHQLSLLKFQNDSKVKINSCWSVMQRSGADLYHNDNPPTNIMLHDFTMIKLEKGTIWWKTFVIACQKAFGSSSPKSHGGNTAGFQQSLLWFHKRSVGYYYDFTKEVLISQKKCWLLLWFHKSEYYDFTKEVLVIIMIS